MPAKLGLIKWIVLRGWLRWMPILARLLGAFDSPFAITIEKLLLLRSLLLAYWVGTDVVLPYRLLLHLLNIMIKRACRFAVAVGSPFAITFDKIVYRSIVFLGLNAHVVQKRIRLLLMFSHKVFHAVVG